MSEIKFDFKGIVNLLAKHLYSEKKVFIRELIQNSHDAIRRRQSREPGGGGRIDIYCRPEEDRIIFKDTGLGMDKSDLEEHLSSVGASGTRESQVEGVIGQFGIGFLSAFIVGKRVEVRTRKLGETQGWLWVNEGDQSYTLDPCDMLEVGTTVDVTVAEIGDRGLIQEEFVREVIRQYCDLLLVPIHVAASEFPINTMRMPWERDSVSDDEQRLDCHVYLEKTMRDSVLETIPLRLKQDGLEAKGVLYISRARMVMIEPPRTVRVFQKRMFLCENAVDLLPKWASFVNGVIDTPSLTPTAARDNFQRDETFGRLRDALGLMVISHLEGLKTRDPDRLSQILNYHDLSIKAACDFYRDFFDKFAHLLEWKVNNGQVVERHKGELSFRRLTLADILRSLPERPDAPKRLSAFSTASSANQYFDMANANGTLVVDASHPWDSKILDRLSKRTGSGFELLFIDREEDPSVFRSLNESGSEAVRRLAEAMAQLIRPGGARLRVEARHFHPADLVAVIRASALTPGLQRAREMIEDPNVTGRMREMAEEMMRMSRGETMRLTINADNPFIQRLSRQDFHDQAVAGLMLGVYNNAILYNQELMTPYNARIFHDQFAELLGHSLQYLEERATLNEERTQLAHERQQIDAENGRQRLAHATFFLMTPFEGYNELENALRTVVEDRWGCQLFLARDHLFADNIRDNVQAHMEQADAFLAEVSEQNPNVMFELGAARFGAHDRPVLLLCRPSPGEVKPKLPADLNGLIYCQYSSIQEYGTLADYLEVELRKYEKLMQRLGNADREHYISARRLMEVASVKLDDRQAGALARQWPTLQRWRSARPEALSRCAGLRMKQAETLLDDILTTVTPP